MWNLEARRFWLGSFFAMSIISTASAQEAANATKAVHVIGLVGIKDNAKGTLSVEDGKLRFIREKKANDVKVADIQDVVTGGDTEKAVGKTIGMVSMAAPYGGGRFLSLFRKKIDTLTVQYRDEDGSLHGAIFTMAVGNAAEIKKKLVASGAHTSEPDAPGSKQAPDAGTTDKEKKQ